MSGNELILNYYVTELLSVKQAYVKNRHIIAKPILLISTFDAIEQDLLCNNRFEYDVLYDQYKSNMDYYGEITPMQYPFYFMSSDGFWHLKWKKEPIKKKSPSAKFVRDNIEYAYFDNALWDLLQDPKNRQKLRETLVTHFLTR